MDKTPKECAIGYSQTIKKMMFYVGPIVDVLLCKWCFKMLRHLKLWMNFDLNMEANRVLILSVFNLFLQRVKK
jgi:hypothetical protein